MKSAERRRLTHESLGARGRRMAFELHDHFAGNIFLGVQECGNKKYGNDEGDARPQKMRPIQRYRLTDHATPNVLPSRLTTRRINLRQKSFSFIGPWSWGIERLTGSLHHKAGKTVSSRDEYQYRNNAKHENETAPRKGPKRRIKIDGRRLNTHTRKTDENDQFRAPEPNLSAMETFESRRCCLSQRPEIS